MKVWYSLNDATESVTIKDADADADVSDLINDIIGDNISLQQVEPDTVKVYPPGTDTANLLIQGTQPLRRGLPCHSKEFPPTTENTPLIVTAPSRYYSLKNGIPSLVQQISLSPPSIPTSDSHAPVRFIQKEFGELREKEFEKIFHTQSRCWADCNDKTGHVPYGSENDVAVLVNGLVKDLIKAMGLDLQTFTGLGAFGVRPDVWVVTWNLIPIGVIEVKKPDEDEKSSGKSILDETTVLGELYDFQMKLPNFYGVRPAFGILTTFETWRICWIPENNDANTDKMARDLESLPNPRDPFFTPQKSASSKLVSPPGTTPSKTNPVRHNIEDEQVEEGGDVEKGTNEAVDRTKNDPRILHGSKIYRRMDENHLAMRAIAAAVCKMTKVKQNPLLSPFDNLNDRMLLRFTKGPSESIHWCRMGKVAPQWNKYANPSKYLFAIEDLGRGSDGRVWLTCTSSGAICVLKFPITAKSSRFEEVANELENWKNAYPEFEKKVFHEKWCGREALRMPHFATVCRGQRMDVLDLVKTSLQAHFVANELVHQDVAWRNIGLYRDGAAEHAVVFDLGRVQKAMAGDKDWVDEAIAKLERDA